ncbi:MFS transporter [Marivita sp. XM-24bin2]|uniref:MFS transporter n=1 Tax=unclassified Marivita TaxID=2632480 RepID=UPI0025BC1830|nr:MFS transporter [Marivita sp. XM-24bin2]MCR9107783.1 MFS transporter [Paracoccaceae bacterium]
MRTPPPLLLTLTLYLAGLGAAGQFSKLAVSFVTLTEVYAGHGEAILGLAVSLISLVGLILGLVAGIVVTRIGARRALLAALALGAVMSLWQATLPSLPVLMVSRVLEGASHLLIVVAAPTLIAETTPDRYRPAALTLWSTFFGVAFALTAVIAPGVIAHGGLALLIGGHGVWMAVAGLAVLLVLPRPVMAPSPPSRVSLLRRHVTAYATPGIATPALAWLCYTLTFVSVLTALPLLTQGTAPTWLVAIAPLVSIGVALTVGVALLSRHPARPVVTLGFALCVAVAVGILLAGFTAVTVILLFACMAFVQSAGFAIVPQINPDAASRALANGALAQMGNLGNLTGTPLLIALYQGAPVLGPFLFLVIAYGSGVAISWVLGRRAVAAMDAGPVSVD